MSGRAYEGTIFSDSDRFDWFYFDLPAGGTVEARLSGIPQGCNYDLYIANDAGLIQDSAEEGNRDEHIGPLFLAAGRYYAGVVQITGADPQAPYALTVVY